MLIVNKTVNSRPISGIAGRSLSLLLPKEAQNGSGSTITRGFVPHLNGDLCFSEHLGKRKRERAVLGVG
jgi:hypothetical protein